MKKIYFAVISLGFVLCAAQAEAANWYVRPSGGSGAGTSWTAAWNGMSGINWGSVACGDTIWAAGGSYPQALKPQKNCFSASRLYIRRARGDAPECTGASGWTSAYDSTVRQIRAGVMFNSGANYITISGRTAASGGGYGWWIDFQGATAGSGIEWPNGSSASYNTVEYVDLDGPGNITYSGDGRGVDATPFSSATGNTLSHMAIHDWESAVYNAGINNTTFEYIDMYDIMAMNWWSYHPNGIFISDSNNGIVRYSLFHTGPGGHSVGEGIFWQHTGSCSNWQIYGNVFYDINRTGTKAIEITTVVPNLKIYNNTFDNVLNVLYAQASAGTGAEFKNNLFYNSGSGWSWGATSNNLTVSSASVFVDRANRNYRIAEAIGTGYPRNAGTTLAADGFVNYDPARNLRGADGAWDIGAYEYGGTAAPAPYCGDKSCNNGETCSSCPGDCGACQPAPSCSDCIEAESGTLTAPMARGNDQSATGGLYIETNTSESGTAAHTFNITAPGSYKFTTRVFAASDGNDSFYFTLDSNAEDIWDMNPAGDPSLFNKWIELDINKRGNGTFDKPQYQPYTLYLSADTHTLIFRGREAGTKLDYFKPVMISTTAKKGDLNSDNKVDVTDLGMLLGNWNNAACPEPCRGDINQDGKVDVTDLGILLGNWG